MSSTWSDPAVRYAYRMQLEQAADHNEAGGTQYADGNSRQSWIDQGLRSVGIMDGAPAPGPALDTPEPTAPKALGGLQSAVRPLGAGMNTGVAGPQPPSSLTPGLAGLQGAVAQPAPQSLDAAAPAPLKPPMTPGAPSPTAQAPQSPVVNPWAQRRQGRRSSAANSLSTPSNSLAGLQSAVR